jgi:hypothetical protein
MGAEAIIRDVPASVGVAVEVERLAVGVAAPDGRDGLGSRLLGGTARRTRRGLQ